jgi:diguanylate cyclase (GGDEF)-like protein/PAS domain S-box-containing protein
MPLADLLASLYQGNPDAIAVYDRDGLLVACNDAAMRLSGYASAQEIPGKHFREHAFHRDSERVDSAFQAALDGGTDHFETTIRTAHGAIVPVEVHVFPARDSDSVQGVFVQARDATTLRAAEQFVELSRERFRSLFEYHPDAAMSLKDDGRISRVNVAMESITGFYGEELIGKPWTDLLAPECRAQSDEALRAVRRGEAGEFDTFLLDRRGNSIEVQMKLVPLRVGDVVEGAYAIAKSVEAQRNAERAIALQGDRIRDLYLAAAARGGSIESQIDDTLALGCRLFGFDYGYVTRFGDATISILNATGEGTGVYAGAVYPRATALSRHLMGERRVLFIPDLNEAPWDADPARATAPWRSYFAARLVVNDREFGAMVFAGRAPHGPIPDLDRDLLQLMALFIAAALERAQHSERIEQLAFYDSLTGLPNRVLFNDRVKQTMSAARRYGRAFAVMYMDLDDFKEINDRYGHPAGDLVLKAVADRLILALRESDTVARFGGDEFVILQPVVNGADDAEDLARKIVDSMQVPLHVGGVDHYVHTSIGIALFPTDAVTADELMERADRALYRAKRAGRNRWLFSETPAG